MDDLFAYSPLLQTSTKTALDVWQFDTDQIQVVDVIPDGCRDLIFTQTPDGEVGWFISPLGTSTQKIPLSAGTSMTGVRFKPGTQINEQALRRWSSLHHPSELLKDNCLDEFCDLKISTIEILACLKSGVTSITTAARELGICARTLQREVKLYTGTTPHFWLALARVRRTCRALPDFQSMAECAHASGYYDQAHMTREIRRVFGVTPSAVMNNAALQLQLAQSGYD